jgi:hypothetical protein
MKTVKNRPGTAEKDSAAPGLFYFVLSVLYVPRYKEKPSMTGIVPGYGRFPISI